MTTRRLVPLATLVAVAVSLSCSRPDDAHKKEGKARSEARDDAEALRTESQSSGPSMGESSAALGQRLRKLHEAADSATTAQERATAGTALLSLYESLGADDSPHLISVRQDLAARAAQLLLETSPARARKAAEQALKISAAPSVLRANLFLALADAEEALGNTEKAKKALVFALSINEELFESEMNTP